MNVDGRAIALELERELQKSFSGSGAILSVLALRPDFATQKFLALKRSFAERIGVAVVDLVPEAETTEACLALLERAAAESDGIIVQLPLPKAIDAERLLHILPRSHDVDVISPTSYEAFSKGEDSVLPPVVGALREILNRHAVARAGKRVAVVGSGRLVGKPASIWFAHEGSLVSVVEKGDDVASATRTADIVVLGAGEPGFFTPEMMKDGAIILDAGTSESAGKLAGDADSACAEKASLFTPVPGGVGPVTVAMIFENLRLLMQKK